MAEGIYTIEEEDEGLVQERSRNPVNKLFEAHTLLLDRVNLGTRL
jgi:hypothetical protein